jgi:solute carrier family 25 protein 14/30
MPTASHVAKEVAAAGIGCAIVDGFFNPLEVLKVRLQAHSAHNTQSNSATSATTILRSEGIVQVWSAGLFPTVLRSVCYVGLRIGLYPTVKGLLGVHEKGTEPFHIKLLAGAICGGLGSSLFSPLDLVGLRFKANRLAYANTFAAFATIIHQNGVSGLWRGCSANVLRATLISGTQLSVYDQTKAVLKQGRLGAAVEQEGPVMHMVASLLSGTVAQFVVMPVDALKTALMMQPPAANCATPAPTSTAPLTLTQAARRLHATLGVRGFYRGLAPALLRQGPSMLIQVEVPPRSFLPVHCANCGLLRSIITEQMPLIEQLRKLMGLGYI